MQLPRKLQFMVVVVSMAFALSSCQSYSTAIRKRPLHASQTPAGQIIAAKLRHPSRDPVVQIGGYLDAAAKAAAVLRSNPGDAASRSDYNFAVRKVGEVLYRVNYLHAKTPQGPNASLELLGRPEVVEQRSQPLALVGIIGAMVRQPGGHNEGRQRGRQHQ